MASKQITLSLTSSLTSRISFHLSRLFPCWSVCSVGQYWAPQLQEPCHPHSWAATINDPSLPLPGMLAVFLPLLSFSPPPHRQQGFVLLVFLSVYSTQFLPFQPYCSNPASYLEYSLKIALPVLSQIISISAFPNYLLGFFPSMMKTWPSLWILAVLVCLGTLSCCLSPHQRQTPHPCFLYLFLLSVPSSSFQFLCSSPCIHFSSVLPDGSLESGMSSWHAGSHFSRERGESAAHLPAYVGVLPMYHVRAGPSSACAVSLSPSAEVGVTAAGDKKEQWWWWGGARRDIGSPSSFVLLDTEITS